VSCRSLTPKKERQGGFVGARGEGTHRPTPLGAKVSAEPPKGYAAEPSGRVQDLGKVRRNLSKVFGNPWKVLGNP